jgi:predicted TIM-barrel fold metal-dependent hydrolase
MFASLRRWIGMDKIPEQIPIASTLGAMAAGGVNQALLSAWWGPQGPILSNADVYEAVQAHPDRLFGVASVDLYRPVDAVRELRRCVRDLGFRAVRVVPWLWNLPPDDRLYYPLYAECVDLAIPFCLQVGHTGPMRPSEPGRPIPYLDRVALDFPDLTIVAGHIGFPWTNEMICLATKYPNVYIDTSAYKASRYPPELVAYLQGHGRKKVMFGTNFPMIQFADALKDIQSLGLDDDARRLFLFENARRVFHLK